MAEIDTDGNVASLNQYMRGIDDAEARLEKFNEALADEIQPMIEEAQNRYNELVKEYDLDIWSNQFSDYLKEI